MKGIEIPTSLIFWLIVFLIVVVIVVGLAMFAGDYGKYIIDLIPELV